MAKKKKKSGVGKIVTIVVALLVVVVGIVGYIAYSSTMLPNIYINNDKARFLYVYPTDNFDKVVARLDSTGNVKDIASFKKIAEYQDYPSNIVPGRYELVNQMSNVQLVNNLKKGRQAPMNLTFNNIRTKEQLCKRFDEALMLTYDDIYSLLNSDDAMAKYNLNSKTSVAMFIPNTYQVYWTISAQDLLDKMKKEYDKFWNEDRIKKCADANLTQVEVSTLAAIVEEETKSVKEQPTVAGLYLNRLHKGMLLQADPTVKFAVGDFSIRRIRGAHLEVDSPYNTYKYEGLPPGPIRIPSMNAIDAVLNYDHHDYIYMCASERFDGTHNFAKSFDDHQENAKKYHKALNRRRIK